MLRTRAVLQKPEQPINQSICSAKEARQNRWGRWFQPILAVGAIGARLFSLHGSKENIRSVLEIEGCPSFFLLFIPTSSQK